MKILLLTDGSTHSLDAARWLAAHATQLRDAPDTHLLHVHPPMPYPGAAAIAGRAAVEDYQRGACEEALAGSAAVLQGANVRFHMSWIVGEVAPTITQYVRTGKFDLVVMGTHGHGALANIALGSIATKCIASLGVPIVVVPRPH